MTEKVLRETPLHAESAALGASFGEWFECRLPSRYGNAGEEIAAARESVAFFDTNFRGFLSLAGSDRARYLNAVTTADIKNLGEGQGNVGLLLNPKGHILAEIETYALPETLLLVTHASVLARTQETLERFIIMDDCVIEDLSARFGSLAVEGPGAQAVMESLCGVAADSLPMEPWSHIAVKIGGADCHLVRRSFYSDAGFEIFTPTGQLGAIWRAVAEQVKAQGGRPIGYDALNVLRLEARIPWFGYDFDDRVLPQEAGVELTHISYTKGCYTGQEIVERVRSRGHVNRKRTMLIFHGAEIPERGTILMAGAAEAGVVTSAAFSPVRGAGIGMGFVRREQAGIGARTTWAGGSAEVIGEQAGAVSHSPGGCPQG